MSSRPHPLLIPFLPHKTILYTPTNVSLPCTIDPLSSRSFITFSTLKQHFAPLHLNLKDIYPPLPSLLPPAARVGAAAVKVKTPKVVSLGFAFRDVLGERVEVAWDVMVSEYKGLEGRVVLGVDFLAACGGRIEQSGDGGVGGGGVGVLVLGGGGGRRVVLERVEGIAEG
jgi:hypothetical protein